MEIKLNDQQMQSVVALAIAEYLTPEKREQLIKEGIQKLLEGNGYNGSHLKYLFDRSVEEIARDEMKKLVLNDEIFMTNLRSVIQEAAVNAFDEKRRVEIVEAMTRSLVIALRK